MTTQIIPTEPSALFWTQTTTLDGTPYFLEFRYNARELAYYLNILSVDQKTTYAQGIKLVSDFPLLMGYALPPGELMVLAYGADDSPPRIGDFGVRADLMYFEAADEYASNVEPQRNPFFGLP